ncbi:Mut7-C RNAse domain-containing protein [Desulfocastanea catecholica]
MKTDAAHADSTNLLLTFYGDTVELLRRTPDDAQTIVYRLARRASIKDILEGLGVPHTEVGRIVLAGQEQTFEKIAEVGEHFHIHPLSPAMPPTVTTVLRPDPLGDCIFLVDINVARLAGLLRMVGFDAEAVDREMTNSATLDRAIDEKRILLTRNRDLLKQRRLVFGHLVRSQDPEEQLKEIINLYNLQERIRPFSRCIACNGLLAEVDKKTIIDRLLPLTRKYFNRFHQCIGCGKIYWQGSHHHKMSAQLARILDKTQ